MKLIGMLALASFSGGAVAAPAAAGGGVVFGATVVGEALMAKQTVIDTAHEGQQAELIANIQADRRYAIDQAWKQEVELVRATGRGTYPMDARTD